jgi:hypothetical protein
MNCEYAVVMNLKPQDVLLPLKLLADKTPPQTTVALAQSLDLSVGETHNALKRGLEAGLLSFDGRYAPVRRALEEFLLHGLKYVFVAERGELTRGIPTAHAAAPLNELILDNGEPPPVWSDPQGTVRGYALSPLYPSVTSIARKDAAMHEWLALIDAVRIGQARERRLAQQIIRERLAQA